MNYPTDVLRPFVDKGVTATPIRGDSASLRLGDSDLLSLLVSAGYCTGGRRNQQLQRNPSSKAPPGSTKRTAPYPAAVAPVVSGGGGGGGCRTSKSVRPDTAIVEYVGQPIWGAPPQPAPRRPRLLSNMTYAHVVAGGGGVDSAVVTEAISTTRIYVVFSAEMEALGSTSKRLGRLDVGGAARTSPYGVDEVCAAYSAARRRWYRAGVLSVEPTGEYSLFAFDLGFVEERVAHSDTRELTPRLADQPILACHLSLADCRWVDGRTEFDPEHIPANADVRVTSLYSIPKPF